MEGRAELIRDRATFQQHWRPDLDKWFEKGVDTPGLVLLKVRATRIGVRIGRRAIRHLFKSKSEAGHCAVAFLLARGIGLHVLTAERTGGMLGGAGAGGLLSGGIGELLERFNLNGQGETAQSWINSGPNKEISPQQLKQAIGSDVLEKLEQQTGLSQEELLARLSRELPTAVDKYTPDGRLPAA